MGFRDETVRGEALVTARGIEGGAVYALSGPLRDAIAGHGPAVISIDLRPDMPVGDLAARLAKPRGKQSLANFLRKAVGLAPVEIGLLHETAPTRVAESVIGTATPYGFVAEVGSGAVAGLPAGATPYLGETGIESQVRDGATNAILAECEDTEVGRKYAADLNSGASGAASAWVNGYLSSFATWQYAKDAFDKWAALTARRLATLRAS